MPSDRRRLAEIAIDRELARRIAAAEVAAAAQKQACALAARALKDRETIPDDITADIYWP